MMDKFIDDATAFVIAIAAVAGGVGGCTIAAHKLLSEKRMPLSFAAAYTFAGGVFGVVGMVLIKIMLDTYVNVERTLLFGFVFGATGAASLASINFSARMILQRLGIEVTVDIHKRPKKG
jgi:hypothetical protein